MMRNHPQTTPKQRSCFWFLFGYPGVAALRAASPLAALALFASLAAVLVGGCASDGADQPAPTDDAGNVLQRSPNLSGLTPSAVTAPASVSAYDQGWSIVLGVMRGPDHQRDAQTALEAVRTRGGLPDAVVQQRGEATTIAVGSFTAADSPEAKRELARVRAMVIEGQRPYEYAFFMPPELNAGANPNAPDAGAGASAASSAGGTAAGGGGAAGGGATGSSFNLVAARARVGASAKYTLQVASYGSPDIRTDPTPAQLAEARQKAEQAVAALRRDGEEAYFYHGPKLSMVTVGLFDDDVLKAESTIDFAQLKRRFPNHLYNGQGVRQRFVGSTGAELQKSFLVKIPER
jgi:hypothetical protein